MEDLVWVEFFRTVVFTMQRTLHNMEDSDDSAVWIRWNIRICFKILIDLFLQASLSTPFRSLQRWPHTGLHTQNWEFGRRRHNCLWGRVQHAMSGFSFLKWQDPWYKKTRLGTLVLTTQGKLITEMPEMCGTKDWYTWLIPAFCANWFFRGTWKIFNLGKPPKKKKIQNVNFFQIGLDPPPSPLKM